MCMSMSVCVCKCVCRGGWVFGALTPRSGVSGKPQNTNNGPLYKAKTGGFKATAEVEK